MELRKKICLLLSACMCLLFFAGCETMATKSDVDTVKEKVTYVEGDLYATTKAIAERLEAIEKNTDTRFSITSERMDNLSKDRATLAEELSSLRDDIKKIQGRIDELEYRHAEQLKAENESAEKTEFEMRRDIEGIKKTYADIITSISALNKNLSSIQSDILTINRSQVTVAESLNRLSADIEKIKDQNTAAERKMGANMTVFLDELTRQESEITHLKSIVKSSSAPDTAVTAVPDMKKESSSTKTYVVKNGDTLGKIAERHKTSINALKKKNNLKTDTVFTGQKLLIP